MSDSKTKYCKRCDRVLPIEHFHNSKNMKDGKSFYCRECAGEYGKKYRQTADGIFSLLSGRTIHRNKFKDYHNLKITREEFVKWHNKQEKKCVYCGVKESDLIYLTDKYNSRSDRLSIDCMNNDLGYVKGNLVLCCWRCNALKSDVFTYEEMREIGEKYLSMKWYLDLHRGMADGTHN